MGTGLSMLAACGPLADGRQTAITPGQPRRTEQPESQPSAATAGHVVLSLEENGFAHLFAYQTATTPLTRLTYGEWNDIAPALSPNGRQIAFASNRRGFWDLYLLDVTEGRLAQLTDTPEYDSAPSWSPDGQWLTFETYIDDNLEVAILSVEDPERSFVRLTADRAADHSPAWAPDGRRIAYVSTHGGNSDVWIAELDLVDSDRFRNVSNTPQAAESYPAWSPDGSRLLWATVSQSAGYSGIYLFEMADDVRPARWVGDGSRAIWNDSGDGVIAALSSPNQEYMSSFDLDGVLRIPPQRLPGRLRGLASGAAAFPPTLPGSLAAAAAETPSPPWAPVVTPADEVPAKRWYLVDLSGVQAPYPQMHDLVDESFAAVRRRMLKESGWDVLASLENAFVPLSTALDPGKQEDWLYTGRAFAINSLMANAGWMTIVREDFGAQTFWRLYIRCTVQDGSRGAPIHEAPWDLNARYELEPLAYEQGGRYAEAPSGYWVDVTALAAAYGWERLPALPNWRSYYAGTRFSEFVLTGGLDWYEAMLELYPAEALVTPTRVLPPTTTPTRTPRPSPSPGPSRTPRPTASPTSTRTPTGTPPPTSTPPTIIP
jgi:TolB protein